METGTKILIAVAAVTLVGGGGYLIYQQNKNANPPADDKSNNNQPSGAFLPPNFDMPGENTIKRKQVYDKIAELERDTSKEGVKKLQTYLNTELGAGYVSLKVDGIRGAKTNQAITDLKKLTDERYKLAGLSGNYFETSKSNLEIVIPKVDWYRDIVGKIIIKAGNRKLGFDIKKNDSKIKLKGNKEPIPIGRYKLSVYKLTSESNVYHFDFFKSNNLSELILRIVVDFKNQTIKREANYNELSQKKLPSTKNIGYNLI